MHTYKSLMKEKIKVLNLLQIPTNRKLKSWMELLINYQED
jgi:hypothetical protein